ncbi:ROK family protein [Nakamurella silvestris]|nr:ROK family protein [Nakamurella silvestris]
MTERADLVVALDVGGTSVKAGLVDSAGRIHAELRRPTGVGGGVDAVVDGLIGVITELVEQAESTGRTPEAIGLGVPGIVDGPAGIARYSANLGWRDLPLAQLLRQRFGHPVTLGHDVRLGGLAEARMGAGAGVDSIFFLSIGTGVAGAVTRLGQVESGATGQAGEVGHLIVRPGGPMCGCGNRGCVEAIASAARIADRYSSESGRTVTAEEVVAQVTAGDPLAVEVWQDAVGALADALASVTVLFDPGRIVVGGGLSLAGATLIDPLTTALRARLRFRLPPPVAVTELGDRAGLIGAGLQAWDFLASDTKALSLQADSPGPERAILSTTP